MYRISEDKGIKIVTIELSGFMDLGEFVVFTQKLLLVLQQYKEKEVSILALVERLDPISQESLQICLDSLSKTTKYFNKMAFVNRRVVTRMQSERIINLLFKEKGIKIETQTFKTTREALAFLR